MKKELLLFLKKNSNLICCDKIYNLQNKQLKIKSIK